MPSIRHWKGALTAESVRVMAHRSRRNRTWVWRAVTEPLINLEKNRNFIPRFGRIGIVSSPKASGLHDLQEWSRVVVDSLKAALLCFISLILTQAVDDCVWLSTVRLICSRVTGDKAPTIVNPYYNYNTRSNMQHARLQVTTKSYYIYHTRVQQILQDLHNSCRPH